MSHLKGPITITEQDLYTSSADKLHEVGTKAEGSKGRLFRYVRAGELMVAGYLYQEAAQNTTQENMVIPTAGVAGDLYINVTNGTATITSKMFEGGTITVYTAGTSLVGEEYIIKKVTGPVAGLTSGVALKVYIDRPLRKAILTTATVNMKRSPWADVIIAPITTATGMPVGVAIYPIASGEYGWILSHGEGTIVSSNQTAIIGSEIGTPCLDAAGEATVYSVGSGHQRVGYTRQANASTKGIAAFIQID